MDIAHVSEADGGASEDTHICPRAPVIEGVAHLGAHLPAEVVARVERRKQRVGVDCTMVKAISAVSPKWRGAGTHIAAVASRWRRI